MPNVSIVTATYNRSNVLRLTIESVLGSSFSDWELIVVGDGCTDDTASVVASFGDPRIRFVNLEGNFGEQSGPNNEGVALARGRYIAFLNHDDLWTASHLSLAVAELETGAAPFVHTLALTVGADGIPTISGATRSGVYEPYAFAPASSWVFRRDLTEQLGPWRPARSMVLTPSADWLFRAWKRGMPMRTIPEVTVVCVLSGDRSRSYAERHSAENERWANGLRTDPGFLNKQIAAIAVRETMRDLGIARHLLRAAKNVVRRLSFTLGLHPFTLRAAIHGRGGFVDRLRRTRGLPPLRRREVRS